MIKGIYTLSNSVPYPMLYASFKAEKKSIIYVDIDFLIARLHCHFLFKSIACTHLTNTSGQRRISIISKVKFLYDDWIMVFLKETFIKAVVSLGKYLDILILIHQY